MQKPNRKLLTKNGTQNGKKDFFLWLFPMSIVILIVFLLPDAGHAIGDLNVYAFPGVWAQDIPTSYIGQLHLRYLTHDEVYDASGHRHDVDDFQAFQAVGKLMHVQRLPHKQWQLTNVLILPWANLNVDVPGEDISDSGMGDPISANFLGWHNKAKNVHLAGGACVFFPIGDYDEDDPINIGCNRWRIDVGVFTHWRLPIGKGMLNADYAISFRFKFRNDDADFNEHDSLEHNLILTYYLTKKCDFGFFIQSDYVLALDSSTVAGDSLHDSDFFSFCIGPGVVYSPRPDWILNLKYEEEVDGREREEGAFLPHSRAIHFMVTKVF